MDQTALKRLIDVAMGRERADLCIRNCRVVDVCTRSIFPADVYVDRGLIVGFGGEDFPYARETVDVQGAYLAPGFIDSHVHIESSHVSPAEFSRLVVPHGTTTIIADPHEICNVCGLDGFDYMLRATEQLPLQVFLQLPSCVPCTPFENAGAVLNAAELVKRIDLDRVLGLGELMNYVGVCAGDEGVLDKLLTARTAGKLVDGHSPVSPGTVWTPTSAPGSARTTSAPRPRSCGTGCAGGCTSSCGRARPPRMCCASCPEWTSTASSFAPSAPTTASPRTW